MKINWKLALMCFAAVAMVMVACSKKDEKGKDDKDGDDDEFVELISVADNSLDDWAKVPAAFLAEAKCPADGNYLGLKSVKVYADELYINILAEYDPEEIPNHESVPFHVYVNTDNSDKTGGYGDEFVDANTDILMEGFFFAGEENSGKGDPCEYTPDVFAWVGEVGASGWEWEQLTPGGEFSHSQHVGNCVEIQMLRELIPTDAGWSEEGFGIGFDIQQSWESVGMLPQVSPTDENPSGHAVKLAVKIDK